MESIKNYEEELRRKWAKVSYFEDGAIQLDLEHPLEWFVRRAQKNEKSLVIVSTNALQDLRSSKCIETACEQRRDGHYAISFTLTDATQEDVFFTMAADIIAFSQTAQNQNQALSLVRKRYASWQRLLDHGRGATLSQNAQKGLFAELFFLKETIQRGMKPAEAVAGWVGPESADQDFVYRNGWYEIKATGLASSHVTISSLEQLDREDKGELIVCRINACAPAQSGALTLRELVLSIHSILQEDATATDLYEERLADAGYIDSENYDEIHFCLARMEHYHVTKDFPRLQRAKVPREVLNATYELDLPGLAPWKNR